MSSLISQSSFWFSKNGLILLVEVIIGVCSVFITFLAISVFIEVYAASSVFSIFFMASSSSYFFFASKFALSLAYLSASALAAASCSSYASFYLASASFSYCCYKANSAASLAAFSSYSFLNFASASFFFYSLASCSSCYFFNIYAASSSASFFYLRSSASSSKLMSSASCLASAAAVSAFYFSRSACLFLRIFKMFSSNSSSSVQTIFNLLKAFVYAIWMYSSSSPQKIMWSIILFTALSFSLILSRSVFPFPPSSLNLQKAPELIRIAGGHALRSSSLTAFLESVNVLHLQKL